MWPFVIKTAITVFIVITASQVAQKNMLLGSLIASLPLTSLLALSWLYNDTQSKTEVIGFCDNLLWLVIASLVFFIVLPLLLRHNWSIITSTILACSSCAAAYGFILFILKK